SASCALTKRSATERLPDRTVVGAVDVVGIAYDGASRAGSPPPPVPERHAAVRRHPARLHVGDDVLSRADPGPGTVDPAVAHGAPPMEYQSPATSGSPSTIFCTSGWRASMISASARICCAAWLKL